MKLTDFVFCDDARQELKNKVSLMGIYNNKLSFDKAEISRWPVGMKAAIMFRLDLEGGIIDEFNLEITNCDIKPFTNPIKIENPKDPAQVILGFPMFPITKPGVMNFNLTFLNHKKIVYEIKPAYVLDIILI